MGNDIKLDLGSVKVHRQVLEGIIAKSVNNLNGVSLIAATMTDKLKELIYGAFHPGIRIKVDEGQEIVIDVMVNVAYGTNIPNIGKKIQEVIKIELKKAIDIDVKDVNVDIEGIEED